MSEPSIPNFQPQFPKRVVFGSWELEIGR
jgi:hypothetical protein